MTHPHTHKEEPRSWEDIKALLYECDEMEFAANRDKLFADVDKLLSTREKEVLEGTRKVFKDYWYYAGKWHRAECAFLMFNDGVCNCKSGKIRQEINERLTTKTEGR